MLVKWLGLRNKPRNMRNSWLLVLFLSLKPNQQHMNIKHIIKLALLAAASSVLFPSCMVSGGYGSKGGMTTYGLPPVGLSLAISSSNSGAYGIGSGGGYCPPQQCNLQGYGRPQGPPPGYCPPQIRPPQPYCPPGYGGNNYGGGYRPPSQYGGSYSRSPYGNSGGRNTSSFMPSYGDAIRGNF